MPKATITPSPDLSGFASDPLTQLVHNGGRKLIEQAIEAGLTLLIAAHANEKTTDGRARLVRHGHLPERDVLTGVGPAVELVIGHVKAEHRMDSN